MRKLYALSYVDCFLEKESEKLVDETELKKDVTNSVKTEKEINSDKTDTLVEKNESIVMFSGPFESCGM